MAHTTGWISRGQLERAPAPRLPDEVIERTKEQYLAALKNLLEG